jgi:hypothetical protein
MAGAVEMHIMQVGVVEAMEDVVAVGAMDGKKLLPTKKMLKGLVDILLRQKMGNCLWAAAAVQDKVMIILLPMEAMVEVLFILLPDI